MLQEQERAVFPHVVYNSDGEAIGQFQLPIHQALFESALRPTSFRERIQAVLAQAHAAVLAAELAEISFEEMGEQHPYTAVEAALREALDDLQRMPTHIHQHDERGFCSCGSDGNA